MSKKMVTKIISALVVIAVVIPPLYFGGYLLHALMAFVAIGGSYEIAKLNKEQVILNTVLYSVVIGILYFASVSLVPGVLGFWAIVLFALELIHGKLDTDRVVFPFILTFVISMALRCANIIYTSIPYGGWRLFLFICLGCFICDTGAYFFGVFFGKHKMIPEVSPNKTWEGSIGGFATGCIFALVYGLLVVPEMPLGLTISASVILPIVAQIGDLSFSSVKRKFGIKDFGNLIPEHGGVLDRVDSLIFCLVAFHALALFFGVIA